jgi:hypothetical protein
MAPFTRAIPIGVFLASAAARASAFASVSVCPPAGTATPVNAAAVMTTIAAAVIRLSTAGVARYSGSGRWEAMPQ